jgi:hypothetical protein
MPQLAIQLLEGLLHVRDVVRGGGHEHRALTQVAAQNADLSVGPEGPGEQPEGCAAAGSTGRPRRRSYGPHILQRPWVDELDREASLGEDRGEGDPVHTGGLPGHGVDSAAGKPIGQGVPISGNGTKRADTAPLRVALFGDGDGVALGADVDAGGIEGDRAELGGEPCGPAPAMRARA